MSNTLPMLPEEIDKFVAYTIVCSSGGDAGLSCALQVVPSTGTACSLIA